VTTKDGKQLDNQLQPSLRCHEGKFSKSWKFIDRMIENPTGGRCVMFTTDEPGRAEGWHKLDDIEGPLLIIVDEAKSVDQRIFDALDRCTYNAMLYASSPGKMLGAFYESQTREELGFLRTRVGLIDCPHIPKDRIDNIILKHGKDSAFTRSTLYGEFMEAEGELRFDSDGLDYISQMAQYHHAKGRLGIIEENNGNYVFLPNPDSGWAWISENPRETFRYMGICDPMTGEQSAGALQRDTHAAGILREATIIEGMKYPDTLVAALYAPGGVRWDIDVLATRLALLAGFYGRCTVVPEANNSGMALIAELKARSVSVWMRTDIDQANTQRQIKKPGFLTTSRTREMLIEKCATAIREKEILITFAPAADQFRTFVISASGKAEAQAGSLDDWVMAIGIGLLVRAFSPYSATSASLTPARRVQSPFAPARLGASEMM
jgi:hypothetical protein